MLSNLLQLLGGSLLVIMSLFHSKNDRLKMASIILTKDNRKERLISIYKETSFMRFGFIYMCFGYLLAIVFDISNGKFNNINRNVNISIIVGVLLMSIAIIISIKIPKWKMKEIEKLCEVKVEGSAWIE